MKKKVLFRACTVYQLINAMNVKLQVLKENVLADIILCASTDFSVFGANLDQLGIFDHVIFSEDNTLTNREIRAMNEEQMKEVLLNPEQFLLPVTVREKEYAFSEWFTDDYEDFYISVDDEYSMLIYYALLKKGNHMSIHIFDESKATYVLDIPKRYRDGKLPHYLYGSRQYLNSIEEILIYEPSLYMAADFGPEIVQLPKIDIENEELVTIYKSVFGCCEVPKEQFIYFEGPFFWDEFVMNDLDVLEELAAIVGKENIIVKMHPRDKVDRYTPRGYKVMRNSIIPWEITTMCCDLSDKILTTITSNAVMTGDFVFDIKNKVIQMDKLLHIGQQAQQLTLYNVFDKKFIRYFNNEQHYYRPDSLDELKEIIIYLKGVIRTNV